MNATIQMSERNQRLWGEMERVAGLVGELRAELDRIPERRHQEAWYTDRVESLRAYERELLRLEALQDRPE